MKQLTINSKGVAATEFMIAFVFIAICLFIVIQFVFFALGGELMTYAKYMGSRSFKVNQYVNPSKVARKFIPWVPYEEINFRSEDIELIINQPISKKCEDNPVWNLEGNVPCK